MLFQKTDNYMISGLIGILAFFPSILPSIQAIYNSDNINKKRNKVKLEEKIIVLPVLYIFVNILFFTIANKWFPESMKNFIVAGILMGLFYPTLGTINDYAKKTYKIKSYVNLYIGAQIMYGIYYGLFIPFALSNIYSK